MNNDKLNEVFAGQYKAITGKAPKRNKRRNWRKRAAAIRGEPTGDSGMSQKVAKLLARAARATGLNLDTLKRQWAATPHEKRGTVRVNLEKKIEEIEATAAARLKAQGWEA